MKLLVCGSAGFLMSNFMRYLMYRSKDYEIISVDKLIHPEDFKRVYLNKNHRFYIGDVSNEYFMDRLIYIEKPNYIINGIGHLSFEPDKMELHRKTILDSIFTLSKYNIPVIQLASEFDIQFEKIFSKNGPMLILPNCFGFRQRSTVGLAKVINDIINSNEPIITSTKKLPWVFAEDVASFIWYIIEKNITETVKMPPLGFMDTKTMVEMIFRILNKNTKIKVIPYVGGNEVYPIKPFQDWVPDSLSLENSIEKTTNWFKTNKWALGGVYI